MKNKYGNTDNLNKPSILMKGLQNTHSTGNKVMATEEILQTEPEHVAGSQS